MPGHYKVADERNDILREFAEKKLGRHITNREWYGDFITKWKLIYFGNVYNLRNLELDLSTKKES